ncbi:hypothetical protein AXE76_02570 [Gardnerella vaginalis]|uniref:LPXTG-motif protein cell wall anchor domain protein n=1 Tax=Gardnerella vaginalis TaxID=2702 RepID=A0A3E1IQQ3_GARVA|nr:hypothetical protein [Gardnerella vaginalis]RFD75103.1 hypothetical protein AXE76_02570 [Gardnerella vaginalis]
MSDLHRNSRFLRFLRSICAKTACARRVIVALFVAVATILATFMIMPSASMGASQQGETKQAQTQSEKPENKTAETAGAPAKNGSAANGENSESKAEEPKTVKPNNPQPSTNPDAPNADHAQNVDSGKKQGTAKEDANKNPNQDVKKDAKDAKKEEPAKKSNRQKRSAKEDDRAAAGNVELPEACKNNEKYNTFAKCYTISYRTYGIENHAVGSGESRKYIYYDEYPQVSKPEIKIAGKKIAGEEPKNLPEGVWLELTNGKVPKKRKKGTIKTYETAYEWAFFKGSNGEYKSKSTENVSNSDGSIRFYLSKWPKKGVNDYRTIVKVHYPDKSVKEIIVKVGISYNNLIRPQANDLTFNIYNHEAKDGQKEVDDSNNSITIDSTSTDPSADDTYNPITPLFIHSSLKQGIGTINHRMVCNKSGTQDYSLDGINGLTLSGSSSGTSTNKWVQSTHNELKKRPNGSAKNSGDQLYEDDDYREQSRSWITGTPQKPGTYVCKVFALKDAHLLFNKVNGDSYVNLFNSIISDKSKLQSVFEDPMNAFYKGASEIVSKIVRKSGGGGGDVNEDVFNRSLSEKQTIDWNVKTIKIDVKSNKKQQPGDNDLKLKVYPFKNGDGSLPAALSDKNNNISTMLGMELKPFVEATSAADSANKITLRVLCSKDEKKAAGSGGASAGGTGSSGSSGDTSGTGSTGSGSAVGGGASTGDSSPSSAQSGSQPAEPSGSSQPAKPSQSAEATWSSKPDGLVLSVPEDTKQTRCNKANDGGKECTAKNVASQASMEVSIKPTDVGNYQCVVFALKNDALTEFESVIKNTKSDSLTPDSIKSELTKVTTASPTEFKENKDFAAFTFNIDSVSNFELPHTGEWNWNLQLGAIAAVMVSVLAAGFVASQSDSYRKLFYERRRC